MENSSELPIGIFDSGLGGLSICKEIMDVLPNESLVYLADSKNAPYGEKSKEEIITFSIKNTELLLELGCKVIVVACNTATTNAINVLRERYDVPFVGIEPAIKPAALQTITGKIGVLATKGTLSSDLFLSTSYQFRDELEIIEVEGTNLVRLIEKGELEETIPLLEKYILPMVNQGVDSIVLGCTHYPFLIPMIRELISEEISIIDSGEAVAKQIQNLLEKDNLLNQNTASNANRFYTNNDVEILKRFLKRIDLDATEISFLEF
ncbi:MAG: glutamate racemase [Flavobacteriales bacterium]|nr:glutamate racemase [Flavobacteriales bacterium]